MKSYKDNLLDSEIDFIGVMYLFWNQRLRIFKLTFVFFAFGLTLALLTPKEYTASSTFIPQAGQSSVGGGFSGLAAVAGINLGGGTNSNDISPKLYPMIVESSGFKSMLIETLIKNPQSDEVMTYAAYYNRFEKPSVLSKIKKYTIGLPGVIITLIKGKSSNDSLTSLPSQHGITNYSSEDLGHFERIDAQLKVVPDIQEGYVKLSFVSDDPLISAQMAFNSELVLQKEILSMKVQKAQEYLNFVEERYLEKKSEFDLIQKKLADFKDGNQNISTESGRSQLRKLESEYDLTLSVYTKLAQQLEEARLKVSEDTPIFTTIQSVTVPRQPSAPNRLKMLFIYVMLGIFVSVLSIILEKVFLLIKKQWTQSVFLGENN